MAKITVTNQLSALRAVFNKMDEVYYSKTPLTVAKLASAITVDMELPVLSDGVTFNTGEPETTEIKLTTGANWVTRTEKGDSDISLQVASLKGVINDLFMDKKRISDLPAIWRRMRIIPVQRIVWLPRKFPALLS